MTELQRYLAEEVAEDHADGIITRREAMRRLGLLGVGGGGRVGAAAPRRSPPGGAARRPARDAARPRRSRTTGRRVGAGGHRGDHLRRARAAR